MPCFINILVAKKFMDKRGVEYQHFQSKNSCLTLSKKLVEEPFCAVCQKFSGFEKVYG